MSVSMVLVTSQVLGYPTRRSGLVVLELRGVWTEASARALCWPSVAVQVYVLPKGRREVAELRVPQK